MMFRQKIIYILATVRSNAILHSPSHDDRTTSIDGPLPKVSAFLAKRAHSGSSLHLVLFVDSRLPGRASVANVGDFHPQRRCTHQDTFTPDKNSFQMILGSELCSDSCLPLALSLDVSTRLKSLHTYVRRMYPSDGTACTVHR
jgi:hypothetical protein